MPPDTRRLLIHVGQAAALRRELGPVGWVVLEAMASTTTPASAEAECSARSLAELVGVSRDTAARALRRLTERGLVVRAGHRGELTGRFGASTYRLDLDATGISVVDDQAVPTTRSTSSSQSRPTDQLTLLQ